MFMESKMLIYNDSKYTQKEQYCYSCFACQQSCPVNAISMCENENGFLQPVIDDNKCVKCNKCVISCPIENFNFNNSKNPKCFAFRAIPEDQENSSSGGAFYIIAKEFIKNGGYVCGASWINDRTVGHIVTNKLEEIEKIRKSKYVQSYLGDCYSEIQTLLKNGTKVLFSGTPCQVAGLYSYLNKQYENLYTIDLICHGTPSNKVFQKYLNEVITNDDDKIININFRKKVDNKRIFSLKTTNFEINDEFSQNTFNHAFLKSYCLKSACYDCKFQTIPRQGDLTIGDFWGLKKYKRKYKKVNGMSVILENNQKGHILNNVLAQNADIYEEVPIKYALKGNICLSRSVYKNKERVLFFKNINNLTLSDAIKLAKDKSDTCDYLIVNFWDSKFNYGAMLTAYAMQEFVEALGYRVKILNTAERTHASWFIGSFMEDFAKRHLNITKEMSFKQAKLYSKNIKGIILGSDQVLRLKFIKSYFNKYLLNFADDSVKKLAISASFGVDCENYKKEVQNDIEFVSLMKNSLKTFDYISCREYSGEKILREVFDTKGETILDPVFLVDKSKYYDLISASRLKIENPSIVSYLLIKNDNYKFVFDLLQKKTGLQVLQLERTNNKFSVQDWLKALYNAEMIITDSFHCVCFAILFNKPFYCIDNGKGGRTRFENLDRMFDIRQYILDDINQLCDIKLDDKIDYAQINDILEQKKDKCLCKLKAVLAEEKVNNTVINKKQIRHRLFFKHIISYFCIVAFALLSLIVFGKIKQKCIQEFYKHRNEIDWN